MTSGAGAGSRPASSVAPDGPDSLAASASKLPTLGDVRPEAVRCWERVRAVLPPSDPTDPDDPSVNLDTLMAMLYAALVMDEALGNDE